MVRLLAMIFFVSVSLNLSAAVLKEDKEFNGVKLLKGSEVSFHPRGWLKTAKPSNNVELNGMRFIKDKEITFYESGKLDSGWLLEGIAVDGIKFAPGYISFYENGNVYKGSLAGAKGEQIEIKGIKFMPDAIQFYESGKVSGGEMESCNYKGGHWADVTEAGDVRCLNVSRTETFSVDEAWVSERAQAEKRKKEIIDYVAGELTTLKAEFPELSGFNTSGSSPEKGIYYKGDGVSLEIKFDQVYNVSFAGEAVKFSSYFEDIKEFLNCRLSGNEELTGRIEGVLKSIPSVMACKPNQTNGNWDDCTYPI